MPIYFYLLHALPESLLMSYVGYGLLGIKLEKKQLLLHAIIYWLGGVLFRSLECLFGWHVLLLIALYALLGLILVQVPIQVSFCAASLAFLCLALGEFALAMPVATLLGWSSQGIVESQTLSIVFGWMSISILLVLVFAIWRFNLVLVNASVLGYKPRQGKM
ncbi:MAG: hypothetical protein PHH90_06385 [Limnochordia bacterium]|nr:hypothetical protein [Limnochordia bacterium]